MNMTKQELLNIKPNADKKALLEKKKNLEKELWLVDCKIQNLQSNQV